MKPIHDMLNEALVEEICKRSAAGEGVEAILREKALPSDETMAWLQKNHHKRIVTAKQEQIRTMSERAKKG